MGPSHRANPKIPIGRPDVRFAAHNGLNAYVAVRPKSAKTGSELFDHLIRPGE
jgi:hypothetical protein